MSKVKEPIMIFTGDGKEIEKDTLIKYAIKSTDTKYYVEYTYKKVLQPPYNFGELVQLKDRSPVLQACIDQKSTDTSGLGYKFVAVENDADENNKEILIDIFNNFSEDIITTMKREEVDFNATGNSFLEIVLDIEGRWKDLKHYSIVDIRKTINENIAVQKIGLNKVYFNKWGHKDESGNPVDIDYKTGDILENNSIDNKASYFKFFTEYDPMNAYYGTPPYLSSIGAIYGNVALTNFNTSFFETYGIPSWAVFIKGDFNGDEDSVNNIRESIKKKLNDIKQTPGSPLIITIDGKEVEIVFEKLSTEVKEGSFRLYKKDNDNEILMTFRMPPQRVGISVEGSLSGSNAEELLKNYKYTVIEPRQYELEAFINKLIKETLDIHDWEFRFKDIDLEDEKTTIEKYERLFKMGAKTPNQIIEELGGDKSDLLGMDDYYINGKNITNPSLEMDAGFVEEVYKSRDAEFITVLKSLEDKAADVDKIEEFKALKSKENKKKETTWWRRWF